jgi:hypothetical protein
MAARTEPTVPAFHRNVVFNAHHSPMGAFFSFTCGHAGTRGGLGAQLNRPADQDVFIGIKQGDRAGDGPLTCLPFFADDAATAPGVSAYRPEQVRRHYGWATDRWVTPDFEFTIFTPFSGIVDADRVSAEYDRSMLREDLRPAVVAELVVDNRKGKKPKTAFFALRFHEPGVRVLDTDLSHGQLGFGLSRRLGFAAACYQADPDPSVGAAFMEPQDAFPFLRDTLEDGLRGRGSLHLLGNCPGIGFEVPPGEKLALRLAFGAYVEGVVSTRLEGRYLYTKLYGSLEDVLSEALDDFELASGFARSLDRELLQSGLSPDQQFLVAHATRSYYGCTQLLEVGGQPYWVVNAGESGTVNTLDFAADQVFWELRQNPWVVRNLLDNYNRFYSYTDRVKHHRTGELHPGGVSFCHDQGVNNNFAPFGRSSYELSDVKGRFSHMTQEQLCNWVLVAASYVAKTNDLDWLRHNGHVIDACLASMRNRDHPDPQKLNGVMRYESERCGKEGHEVTTYDALDPSLAQARNGLYLAVKCWAAYVGLKLMFDRLGVYGEPAAEQARFAANTIAGHLKQDESFIPAVFDKDHPGHHARVLPAVEGLVFPLYWNDCESGAGSTAEALQDYGPYRSLLDALRTHTTTLLRDPEGRNRLPDGGLKLTSASNNSWFSKIALCQHAAREVFDLEIGDARQKAADAAHVKWQTEGPAAYWAMSDLTADAECVGNRYHPRSVTTVLWLDGKK